MKVQIVTYSFQRIVEEILLALEDGGYRIWIKEVETATLIHNIHSSPYSPAMENMDNIGEVVRVADLNDDMAVDYEVAQSDLRKTYDEKDDMTVINVVEDREVVQETPSLQFISNSNRDIERAEDKGEECTYESRTKMVSFSQNGSSEEMLKTLQHLWPLENGEQTPPCFEKERNYHAYDSDSNTNPATLTSGENQLEEEVEPPTGFEFSTIMQPNIKSKKHLPRRSVNSKKNLFTHSNVLLLQSSSQTSESLVQLTRITNTFKKTKLGPTSKLEDK
ncbi:hypothetical protein Cgig2_001744 [Carnegiea gigantea]|uniref:Uncharacterized protein n=1 Tax=Carnegiea gigantea TaxID=171969 RepID=A0A9Q1KAJ0_9CARY|nr:hypothetical protein Cgig2_001744 [Carnegiea gigantea]